MKQVGKRLLRACGLEARRIQTPGSHLRPIGDIVSFLEDIRARGFKPPLIFDVGASDGAWARLVEPVFPAATFVLVEPRPSMQPALDALCRSRSNWKAVASAVGAVEGNGTLTDWETASTLNASPLHDATRTSVRVETLESLAARAGTPALVKLDVEGSELDALRGAGSLFGKTDVFIVEAALFDFEGRPPLDDIINFMRAQDYVVYDIAGFIRRPLDGAVGLMDVCFARASAPLRGPRASW